MRSVGLVAVVMITAGSAFADPAGPPGLAQTIPPPPAPVATGPLDDMAHAAGSERGLLFDTAMTVPAGSVDLGGRCCFDAGAVDAAAGLTSTTELSAEVGVIGDATTFAVGLKQVIVHGARWRIAIEGSARQINPFAVAQPAIGGEPIGGEPNGDGFDYRAPSTNLLGIGGVATACIDDGCRVLVTGGAQALVQLGTGEVTPLVWADIEAGAPRLRAIAEVANIGDTGMGGSGGSIYVVAGRGGWRRLMFEAGAAFLPGDYAGASTQTMPYVGVIARP